MKPVGATFDDLDGVVDALQSARVYGVIAVAEDPFAMLLELSRRADKLWMAYRQRQIAPLIKGPLRPGSVAVSPDQGELVPDFMDRSVHRRVADAVSDAARTSGVSRA